MVACFHGLDIDLASLRRVNAPSQRGLTLRNMMAIADSLGLSPRPVKLPLEALDRLHVPAILHWDMDHFVVLERCERGRALIHNPEGWTRWMPLTEVSDHFTGVALELRPSASFQKGERRERLRLSQLWDSLRGMVPVGAQVFALSLLLAIAALAAPYYLQLALDQAYPALDRDLLAVLALGFGAVVILSMLTELLRAHLLLAAGSSIGLGLASNLARRLFRLPVDWFGRRHVGDVLTRFQSVTPVQSFLTQGAIAGLLDGLIAIATLALMLWYSPLLAGVAVVATTLYALVRLLSFPAERAAQEAAIVAGGKEQSALIESLRGMTTIRMFGRELHRHMQWQNKLVDAVNADIRLARIGIWQSSANTVIFGVSNILLIWLAIRMSMDGGFSVGMVIAFLAYKEQFVGKTAAFINQAIAFRMLNLHLERMGEIALTPEDIAFEGEDRQRPLEGRIELRNVRYRYAPSEPWVLDDVSLSIAAGEHVAITGPSGAGKSTLAALLLGLVQPTEGEVLIDGEPIRQFGLRAYRRQIGAVLQDDTLFAGSLIDNIAFADDQADPERALVAASAAAIHADILAMPMQYNTLVGDMGSALSGGQRQRILLARALYRLPRVLIVDEATSHLDVSTEAAINASIASLGITRIVIAHRQDTIDNADRVIRLDRGRIVIAPDAPRPDLDAELAEGFAE